jgi:hypothetical protein
MNSYPAERCRALRNATAGLPAIVARPGNLFPSWHECQSTGPASQDLRHEARKARGLLCFGRRP